MPRLAAVLASSDSKPELMRLRNALIERAMMCFPATSDECLPPSIPLTWFSIASTLGASDHISTFVILSEVPDIFYGELQTCNRFVCAGTNSV